MRVICKLLITRKQIETLLKLTNIVKYEIVCANINAKFYDRAAFLAANQCSERSEYVYK